METWEVTTEKEEVEKRAERKQLCKIGQNWSKLVKIIITGFLKEIVLPKSNKNYKEILNWNY